MSLQKRTADGGTSTVQRQTKVTADSLLQSLWTVKNMSSLISPMKDVLLTNIPEEMEMYLIGKVYEARKSEASNGKFPYERNRTYKETANYVAEELGIGATTVKRYFRYTRGIDAIRKADAQMAEDILTGRKKTRVMDIMGIGVAKDDARKQMVNAILFGTVRKQGKKYTHEKHSKKDLKKINDCVSSLLGAVDDSKSIASVLKTIRINSEPFINMLRQTIAGDMELCMAHREDLIRTIRNDVINKIEEIEEEIKNYE